MPDRAPETATRIVDRWNTVFDALRAEPRRQLVGELLEAEPDEPVALPEAATSPNQHVDPDALWVELHHHHLPLLADSKYVRWESDPLRAFRGPRFEEVGFVVDTLRENTEDAPDLLTGGSQITCSD